MGGRWWRWALVSPDGVAPSFMVGVSASVNLPLHHKVLAPAQRGGPGKRAVKRLWWWCGGVPKENTVSIIVTGLLQSESLSCCQLSIVIPLD